MVPSRSIYRFCWSSSFLSMLPCVGAKSFSVLLFCQASWSGHRDKHRIFLRFVSRSRRAGHTTCAPDERASAAFPLTTWTKVLGERRGRESGCALLLHHLFTSRPASSPAAVRDGHRPRRWVRALSGRWVPGCICRGSLTSGITPVRGFSLRAEGMPLPLSGFSAARSTTGTRGDHGYFDGMIVSSFAPLHSCSVLIFSDRLVWYCMWEYRLSIIFPTFFVPW